MTDTRRQKTYEELEFTDDFMFCKILQNNEKLCRELLELILQKKIEMIHYPEKQKTIEITSDGKGIRLDVYVEDDKKIVYDVEMQNAKGKDLPKRGRYYQGMIDLNLIERGANYSELKRSYIIFICPFDYYGKGRHLYTFENICKEDSSIIFGDEATKIMLCAGGDADDVSQEMKDFLDFVAGKKAKSKFTKELESAVADARKQEKWRQEFMTLLMRDQENQEIGKEIGERNKLKELIIKKMNKGKTVAVIADELEEEVSVIEDLIAELKSEGAIQ